MKLEYIINESRRIQHRTINTLLSLMVIVVFVILVTTFGLPSSFRTSNESSSIEPPKEILKEPIIPGVIESITPKIPTLEQYHDAISRMHIDQSCYDSKTKIWLVHVPKRPIDTVWQNAWYMSYEKDIEFVILENDTVLITNTHMIFNTQVSPDVNNLDCKKHKMKNE